MSSLLLQNGNVNKLKSSPFKSNNCSSNKKSRHVLKAKENVLKYKCNRALKKKLKKYKLRHDGKEDPDVLDVSNTLIKLLKIKSPNSSSKQNCLEDICEFGEIYPKNYLFKMGKRKVTVKSKETLVNTDTTILNVLEEKTICSSISDTKVVTQRNAFKLMMDSRNKSIGSNSPGKEKPVDEIVLQEHFDKKSIKAKRKLILQKMAESKGSLEKKDLEEYQEHCIKKKLEKRAERFKNMITNKANNLKTDKKYQDFKSKDLKILPSSSEITHERNNISHTEEPITLISIFNDSVNNKSTSHKHTTKEDEEFIKKLSPSLKKKENMLCYFNKLQKDSPVDIKSNFDFESVDNKYIKVKFDTKSKKKTKKGKLSLKKVDTNEGVGNKNDLNKSNDCNEHEIKANVDEVLACGNNKEGRKRKRIEKITCNPEAHSPNYSNELNGLRPKRVIKKPVKYIDDIELFSSDEELHIFTPKKKKTIDNKNKSKTLTKSYHEPKEKISTEMSQNTIELKIEKKTVTESNSQKKSTKLAPIFTCKLQNDPAVIEAKHKFLHSGVPDKLKNKIKQQNKINVGSLIFPTVVHVQQTIVPVSVSSTPLIVNSIESDFSDDLYETCEDNLFKNLLDIGNGLRNRVLSSVSKNDKWITLENIKQTFPKFPVYRTYRLLKDKSKGLLKECGYPDLDNSIEVINGIVEINNDNLDKLNWTSKYRALSAKQVVGNSEAIKELKKWLVVWTENEVKSKKAYVESDSDFYHSETDSKDSMKSSNNILIVTGPIGSGKTTSVYAVAAELAIKVIEVNASSKRTGKIMLQDLQEATQSHKVNRGKGSLENLQKSQDTLYNEKNIKRKGRKKKILQNRKKNTECNQKNEVLSQKEQQVGSQELTRTESSLILIDDADIVFEQDDGFCSAIMQLIQCSKRPVILITSSTSCLHLQRFLQFAKIINMRPLSPKILGTWLDIMCLADSGLCWPGTGAKFLDFFKGDIRKTINSLQFYITSQAQEMKIDKQPDSQNSDSIVNIDDENSSMSWADSEVQEEKSTLHFNSNDNVWKSFLREQSSLLNFGYPIQSFNIWWSLSYLYEILSNSKCTTHGTEISIKTSEYMKNNILNLDIIAKINDALSISDYCDRFTFSKTANILSQPWYSAESDSVSEQENFQTYNKNYEVIDEISHKLITGYITTTQKRNECVITFDIDYPDMTILRKRNKTILQHNTIASYLNPSSVLDRKALALDYWPACRSVCRIEKSKTENNLKRNNRFCHYLKSLNILCKNDYFDDLSNSLNTKRST
ncbi:enhanced level of genomic instability 1 [Galleria mellonella]|uniref:Enhanced level of genomic instability 1 n=1 Tax=Galleria mellonella TaxID=7137 RepID=A0A6J1X0I6_GALME|nr:enhanced level of genomic instability 1 [Galleria mellonella]